MKRLPSIVYAALSAAVLFGGCAPTQKMTLRPNFWQERDHPIGVALVAFPRGNVQNFGSGSGLFYEAKLSSASAPLEYSLKKTYPGNFTRIQKLFTEKLKSKGLKVIEIDDRITRDRASGRADKKEYISIALKFEVDRLILLDLNRFWASCIYSGTYPQMTKANAQVVGEMIDVKSNEVLWRNKFSEGTFDSDVVAKCTEPDDFPMIIDAIRGEIDKGVVYLYEDFFGERPSP
jgi:hypothetical protein